MDLNFMFYRLFWNKTNYLWDVSLCSGKPSDEFSFENQGEIRDIQQNKGLQFETESEWELWSIIIPHLLDSGAMKANNLYRLVVKF